MQTDFDLADRIQHSPLHALFFAVLVVFVGCLGLLLLNALQPKTHDKKKE